MSTKWTLTRAYRSEGGVVRGDRIGADLRMLRHLASFRSVGERDEQESSEPS